MFAKNFPMKSLITIFCCCFLTNYSIAQFNIFQKGTHDYVVYEHYMMLRHYKWTVYWYMILIIKQLHNG